MIYNLRKLRLHFILSVLPARSCVCNVNWYASAILDHATQEVIILILFVLSSKFT